MIVLDTSGLLAALDAGAKQHSAARTVVESDPGPLLLSPFVLAELDYLVSARLGPRAMRPVYEDVAQGAYELASFGPGDIAVAAEVIGHYADQEIGLTDASLVVLAERYRTVRLLTLDERHFRVVRPRWGETFTLLPSDGR